MKERDEKISVNPNENKIFVPGSGNLPIIGLKREELNAAEKQHNKDMVQLRAAISSTWQCTECKQKFPGSVVKVRSNAGLPDLICPECSGPVIIAENALSLTKPPKGNR